MLVGSVLERLKYRHPFENDSLCLTLPASHVTMESGTGLVHTAPAHGQDDYHVGKEHGLDLVREKGEKFNQILIQFRSLATWMTMGVSLVENSTAKTSWMMEMTQVIFWVGLIGYARAFLSSVIAKLKTKEALVKLASYTHRYPHDWRTKKPVILRSTPQWFASLENLKHEAVVRRSRCKPGALM